MSPSPQEFNLTEGILNGKLHFCAVKKERIQKTVKHLKWSFLQKHFCIQMLIYCIIHIQFRKLLSKTYCPEKILSLDLRNLKIAFVFTIRELLISFH